MRLIGAQSCQKLLLGLYPPDHRPPLVRPPRGAAEVVSMRPMCVQYRDP